MTYATTSVDPGTVPLSRLRSGLFDGPGPAGPGALAAALRTAADRTRDTAEDLDALLRHDGAVHDGTAADGARAHLHAVRRDSSADAGRLDRAARAVDELAGHHATARRDVAGEELPAGTSVAALLGAALDGPDPSRRARLAVAAYQDACNAVLSVTLPVFDRV